MRLCMFLFLGSLLLGFASCSPGKGFSPDGHSVEGGFSLLRPELDEVLDSPTVNILWEVFTEPNKPIGVLLSQDQTFNSSFTSYGNPFTKRFQVGVLCPGKTYFIKMERENDSLCSRFSISEIPGWPKSQEYVDTVYLRVDYGPFQPALEEKEMGTLKLLADGPIFQMELGGATISFDYVVEDEATDVFRFVNTSDWNMGDYTSATLEYNPTTNAVSAIYSFGKEAITRYEFWSQ